MNELSNSLEQTLKSDLTNLAFETTEKCLNSCLVDSTILMLPIASLIKTVQSIPNILVSRKIIRFIACLKNTSLEERVMFLERVNSKKRTIGDFYINILNVLQKLEQEEKADIVAFIFKMMLYEKITIEVGNRLILIIANLQLSDLVALSELTEEKILKNQLLLDTLLGSGVLSTLYEMIPSDEPRLAIYKFNAVGENLISVMREYHADEEEKV